MCFVWFHVMRVVKVFICPNLIRFDLAASVVLAEERNAGLLQWNFASV